MKGADRVRLKDNNIMKLSTLLFIVIGVFFVAIPIAAVLQDCNAGSGKLP